MAKGGGKTKNLRFGGEGGGIEDLIDNNIADLTGEEIMEPVFEVDTESIDKEATTIASGIIANVAKVYASETFLKEHPDFRKRLDSELQSLKMHYKMRAFDEKIQDELVRAIGRKADNASLYLALPKLQAAMISTQNKIDATMDRIQALLKSYQTELEFGDEEDEEETEGVEQNGQTTMQFTVMKPVKTRGTRDFIDKYKEMSYEEIMKKQAEEANQVQPELDFTEEGLMEG